MQKIKVEKTKKEVKALTQNQKNVLYNYMCVNFFEYDEGDNPDITKIKEPVLILNSNNVLGFVLKDLRLKYLLKDFIPLQDISNKATDWDFAKVESNQGYSVSYLKLIFNLLEDMDLSSVVIKSAKEYPLVIETPYFNLILSPRYDF